jgi:hypothetical protein
MAVVAGEHDVVTWLLRKLNAKGIKIKDSEGKTAWELACSIKYYRQRFVSRRWNAFLTLIHEL